MNLDIFQDMDAPALKKYLEFILWHYRVVDAFWFIYVGERFDQSAAEKINERVWARVSSMAAVVRADGAAGCCRRRLRVAEREAGWSAGRPGRLGGIACDCVGFGLDWID